MVKFASLFTTADEPETLLKKGKRSLLIEAAFLSATIALMVGVALVHFDWTHDDAYISLRYTRNLASGLGPVFNPGERVEGYSDFLWVVLLVPSAWLQADLALTAKVLGLVFAGGTVYLSNRLFLLLVHGRSSWGLIPGLLLASSFLFGMNAILGLETALFSFLVALSAYLYVKGLLHRGPYWASGLAMALVSMTRPEGPVLFIAAAVHGLLMLVLAKLRFGAYVIWVGVFALAYLPYTAWRLWYFGDLLPNTYYAKIQLGSSAIATGLTYVLGLYHYQSPIFWAMLGLAVVVAAWRLSLTGPVIAAAVFPVSYLAFAVAAGGDIMFSKRFLVPVLPFLFLGAVYVVREFKEVTAGRGPYLRLAGGVFVVAFLPVALYSNFFVEHAELQERNTAFGAAWQRTWYAKVLGAGDLGELARENQLWGRAFAYHDGTWMLSKYLQDHAAPSAVVALSEVGAVPFFTGLRTVDYLGLTDRNIARMRDSEKVAAFVLTKKPDFIVLTVTAQSADASLVGRLPQDRAILQHPDFGRHYRQAMRTAFSEGTSSVPMDNIDFVLFERTGSPAVVH